MVGGPPSVPPPGAEPSAPGQNDPEKNKPHGKGFHAKPMTWMGMHFDSEQATKLWQVIIQSVNREISQMKEKSIKALKKLRKSAEGDDSGGD